MSILYRLHWVYLALDQAFAMLFFASLVGLAVWSRMVETGAGAQRPARRIASRTS